MYTTWSAPSPAGKSSEELALIFDGKRDHRLLVIPPLFAEHNTMRRQLVEFMRRLDGAGIDSVLPDLPGWNESSAPLEEQSISSWRKAVLAALERFKANRILAVRGGSLLLPDDVPSFVYGPVAGRRILRAMVRARTVTAQESGRPERIDELLELGRKEGLELAGYRLGPTMIAELDAAEFAPNRQTRVIEQVELGGAPLWLRGDPADDPEQADALGALIAVSLLQ